jgi:hypothetical protein
MPAHRFESGLPLRFPHRATLRRAACLLGPVVVLSFGACSDDEPDGTTSSGASSSVSGSGGAGGAGAAGAAGGDGGDAGAGATGGAGAGGGGGHGGAGRGGGGQGGGSQGGGGQGGGGAPSSCASIAQDIGGWLGAHQACNDANPCARVDAVEVAGFCNVVAAPGPDQAALDALVSDWDAAACTLNSTCGFEPGTAECVNGQCQLVVDDDCENCPTNFDPVCTVSGGNALNECYAVECFMDQVAHPGFCADSPQCTAAGGTCNETFFDEPPCPDGTKWDEANPDHNCPSGNLRNYCCTPYSEPCSFVSLSGTLNLDPFTCQLPTGPGVPWTCIHMPNQQTCTIPASIEQPFNEVYDATVTVVAHFGNTVTVTGVHNETGNTFTCNGVVSYEPFTAEAWDCTACDGASCTDCIIWESGYCSL